MVEGKEEAGKKKKMNSYRIRDNRRGRCGLKLFERKVQFIKYNMS